MTSEARIGALGAGLGACAALAAGWLRGPAAGAGLASGAALGWLNYAWLKAGAVALTQPEAARGGPVTRPMRLGMALFLARILLLVLGLCAIFISHLVPMEWVLAGLFAIPAGALIEGLRQLARP